MLDQSHVKDSEVLPELAMFGLRGSAGNRTLWMFLSPVMLLQTYSSAAIIFAIVFKS